MWCRRNTIEYCPKSSQDIRLKTKYLCTELTWWVIIYYERASVAEWLGSLTLNHLPVPHWLLWVWYPTRGFEGSYPVGIQKVWASSQVPMFELMHWGSLEVFLHQRTTQDKRDLTILVHTSCIAIKACAVHKCCLPGNKFIHTSLT